jgi:hypothetical protein
MTFRSLSLRHLSVVVRHRRNWMSFCKRRGPGLESRGFNHLGVENLHHRAQTNPLNPFLLHVRLNVVGRRTLEHVERIFESGGFFNRIAAPLDRKRSEGPLVANTPSFTPFRVTPMLVPEGANATLAVPESRQTTPSAAIRGIRLDSDRNNFYRHGCGIARLSKDCQQSASDPKERSIQRPILMRPSRTPAMSV